MLIYNILIRLYFVLISVASVFNKKAAKWIAGRKGLKQQFSGIDFCTDKWVWFHCSSFGEFQDGRTLMEAFKRQHPEIKILLTFFSPTGYELQKDYVTASAVFYLPLDTKSNAFWLLDTVKPIAAFFIRHDIWPNYVRACAKRNVPSFLVSFTLNAGSAFLRWPFQGFYRDIFLQYAAIFVQYEAAEKLLKQHRFSKNIIVTGNSRIDCVAEAAKYSAEHELIKQFVAEDFCCIAGSTHKRDRQLFLKTFALLEGENIKWIIVPHEIDADEIDFAGRELGNKMTLLSTAKCIEQQAKLLWVNQVGLLAAIYRYADIAFIGGGFERAGIHSILEPLVYGCAVCFGPCTRDYRESTDLIARGGAEIIRTPRELAELITKLKNNGECLKEIKNANLNYIIKGGGATQKTMKYLSDKNYFN